MLFYFCLLLSSHWRGIPGCFACSDDPISIMAVPKLYIASKSRRLAEMMPVVLAAFEVAGRRIDGDAFSVAPMAADFELVAEGTQAFDGGVGEAGLHDEDVGQILMVEARSVDGLLDIQALFGGAEEDIRHGGDDARRRRASPARSAPCRPSSTMVGVMAESGRLPGAMALAGPWMSPYMLGTPCFDGEVVHLVVQQKAEAGSRDCRAEGVVEGRGDGDGVAVRVDDGVVRGLGRLVTTSLQWLEAAEGIPQGA